MTYKIHLRLTLLVFGVIMIYDCTIPTVEMEPEIVFNKTNKIGIYLMLIGHNTLMSPHIKWTVSENNLHS